MGRKPIGKKPMTKAQYQARWRAKVKRRLREPNARGDEWGTPTEYLDAARAVLGGIDLDPATHHAAQQRVQAKKFYTEADDGLAQPWHGRVWLNPPYSRGLVNRFAFKLLAELWARHTTEAIVLVNAQTDAEWFQRLRDAAAADCFTNRRIRFLDADGRRLGAPPMTGQAFLYFGPTPERFTEHFAAFGRCVTSTGLGPMKLTTLSD
jgi:ParB family chromosome partitioning protein